MIKDILQQLAPLDEKIAALRGDPADENMTDITNHAAELAELSAQEDALLSGCGALTAEDRVFLARHPERPHIDEIVDALFTDFFEQCGDRQCKEDAAILGGVALFHGQPVTVIGHRKGSTLEENLRCNFGMPGPEGYRKALRLMKQAEKFDRPIITFIDTPGAYPGKDAEERGQGEAIARNLMEMSGLTVPVIAVVTGEGSSGGALALHERVDDLRQILGLGVGQRNEVYVAFALGSGDIQRADRVTRHADGFGIAVDEQAVGAFVGQHEADGGAALFGVLLIPAFEDFGERGGQRLGIAVLQAQRCGGARRIAGFHLFEEGHGLGDVGGRGRQREGVRRGIGGNGVILPEQGGKDLGELGGHADFQGYDLVSSSDPILRPTAASSPCPRPSFSGTIL